VKTVLISTYELGRQPFGLASPAAWLRKNGHEVTVMDLARQELDLAAVRGAGLIAVYLPMHTATRLAAQLIPRLKEQNPSAHLCCYGLYAPMNVDYLRALGVSTIIGGEFEEALAQLADRLSVNGHPSVAPPTETMISLARLVFKVPDRSGMPALERYAHLIVPGNGFRIVGSTEASRGCKHLCRHCPIVPVYNGVFRIVSRDVVLEDCRQQIAAGARHITFGDPDFFNGIRHAMQLVEAFHYEFPDITYDVTIKIEHLLKYRKHLPTLRDTGCIFAISAVESVDDEVLKYLDKGHTREDFLQVARLFRELGMTLHPTFVPFTPWTTVEGYLDLLRVIRQEGLVENLSPIQLAIRLLVPAGSRLLELDSMRRVVAPFDPGLLAHPWRNPHPRVDALCEDIAGIVALGEKRKRSRAEIFEDIWQAAHTAAGMETKLAAEPVLLSRTAVPYLNEPWYC